MNGSQEIWDKVEDFRKKFLAHSSKQIPVDVFTLAEIDLELDIVPFDDLFEKFHCDAALMIDFSGIYVDAEAYELWESGPLWKQKRLRFSVAHEIGHFVLHRAIAKKVSFKDVKSFAKWTSGYHGQQYLLEQAANEFAGRLLVPHTRLEKEFNVFKANLLNFMPNADIGHLRRAFAESMENIFAVNAQVIEIRLEREGFWAAS
jgi:hypothetical protein